MKMRTFLNTLSPEQRQIFADSCNTSVGHLRNIAYGFRECSPELAVAVERESGGQLTRQGLRPSDWDRIWPEIAA